jgi:hypothetical protein
MEKPAASVQDNQSEALEIRRRSVDLDAFFANLARPAPASATIVEYVSPRSLKATSSQYEKSEPEWLLMVNTTKQTPKERTTIKFFNRIRDDIRVIEKALENNEKLVRIAELRTKIHQAFFVVGGVNPVILKVSKMLNPKVGLATIFDSPILPWDIKSDAKELHGKWCSKQFLTDLLVGLNFVEAPSSTPKKPKKRIDLEHKYKEAWKVFGDNHLLNGQWWPRQICAIRDGAHGSSVAGISGISGEGAVSIVYSGTYKGDKDDGEDMWYSGTNSKDTEPTPATNRMLESQKHGKLIRVIRTSNGKSPFKPQKGLRYDGLYKILSSELIEGTLANFVFHLRRQNGQTPIRYSGAAARPTEAEVYAGEKVDLILKGTVG